MATFNNNNENGEIPIDLDAVDVQHQMVEAILDIGEDQIDDVLRAIFNQIGERPAQLRVERRVKFMVHPDKNTHRRAKDAF